MARRGAPRGLARQPVIGYVSRMSARSALPAVARPLGAAVLLVAVVAGATGAAGQAGAADPADAAGPLGPPGGGAWRALEPGLDWRELPVGRPASSGDGVVRALRVDPARFRLRLLMASETAGGQPLTPRQWALRQGLSAAVNAGMYAKDYRTSVSLLRSRRHVNNARVTRHQAVLAFDPLVPGLPPVQILDRELQDFATISRGYGSLVQGIRMVALDGRNVWSAQERGWSVAAAGIDSAGRVLLLHCRSPYPMRDFVDAALALPLGLRNLMYLEGGPVAQLFARDGGEGIELTGCYGEDSPAAGQVASPAAIPNVIGVVRLVPLAPPDVSENPVPWAAR